MTRIALISLLLLGGSASTLADLKPDIVECDAKKAARNAAMDATVGVSGRCDTGKVVDNTKDDVKDAVDIDRKDKDPDKGLIKRDKD